MDYDDNVLLVAQGGGVMSPQILTGVYKAMQEKGSVPGKVLASSGGALFSGLYYSGHDSKWFIELMQKQDLKQWMQLAPVQTVKSIYSKSNYIIDNSGLAKFLLQNMTASAMDRVQVSVTRLNDYQSFLKCATPTYVLAATSIPFLFMPVQIGKYLYGDGGILNNIPMPAFDEIKQYDKVYVVLTPPTEHSGKLQGLTGLLELLNAVMDRQVTQLKEAGYLELPNVHLIQPKSAYGGNLLQWSQGFKMREQAYAITKELV